MGDSAGSGGATGLCAQEQRSLGCRLGWVGGRGVSGGVGGCEGPGAGVRGQQGSQPAGDRTSGCTGVSSGSRAAIGGCYCGRNLFRCLISDAAAAAMMFYCFSSCNWVSNLLEIYANRTFLKHSDETWIRSNYAKFRKIS